MQLRLFQIVQAEEDIEPPADSNKSLSSGGRVRKRSIVESHFLFLCSQISPDLQKQIDDVFIHIVTVHLM